LSQALTRRPKMALPSFFESTPLAQASHGAVVTTIGPGQAVLWSAISS
jgi:hypothetical protein